MKELNIAAKPATAKPALQSPVTTKVYVKFTPVRITLQLITFDIALA
jgi:hypothetical protein